MKNTTPRKINELVINWHLTEACNYSCQYCYAHWERPRRKEVIQDSKKSHLLLKEVAQLFNPNNSKNPLRKNLQWSSVRLNIAGGEPLLYPQKTLNVINLAKSLGLNTSIITNGSLLTKDLIDELAPNLSTLGLSMDSTSEAKNMLIGRTNKLGKQLTLNEFKFSTDRFRSVNPNIKVKLNTVVNRANYKEDFHTAINTLNPERWKVLKMLPVINDNLNVSNQEFASFVDRHELLKHLMVAESNQDMTDSYIMIDPYGRFYQNTDIDLNGYRYSLPITEVGAELAYSNQRLASERFVSRYSNIN